MIQDLDGATTEPSRRRHVAALSAATAVIAMVLLYVLVAPPALVGAPQTASPSPRATSWLTIISNPLINMPVSNPPVEMSLGLCAEAGTTWAPLLSVDATRGPTFPVVVYDRTGSRPVAFVQEERGTGRLIVTCATPDSVVPRINRAR